MIDNKPYTRFNLQEDLIYYLNLAKRVKNKERVSFMIHIITEYFKGVEKKGNFND